MSNEFKSKSRCGRQTQVGKLDCQNEMVRICIKKDRGRCSDENVEDGSGWTPNDRKIKTDGRDVIQKDTKEAGV